MEYQLYYQSPENDDAQGLALRCAGDPGPASGDDWEFVHDPNWAGYAIRDLPSARRWANEMGIIIPIVDARPWP